MTHLLGQFYFVSAHGRLLQGYTNGETHASQKLDSIGNEERWWVHKADENKVALRNMRTNHWLRCHPNGDPKATAETVGHQELWELWKAKNGKIGLRSWNGKFLRSQPAGRDTQFGGEVAADASSLQDDAQYDMVPSAGVPFPGAQWWQQVLQVAVEVAPVLIALA